MSTTYSPDTPKETVPMDGLTAAGGMRQWQSMEGRGRGSDREPRSGHRIVSDAQWRSVWDIVGVATAAEQSAFVERWRSSLLSQLEVEENCECGCAGLVRQHCLTAAHCLLGAMSLR